MLKINWVGVRNIGGAMAKLFDHATADRVARGADYDWSSERGRDPFAVIKALEPLHAAPHRRAPPWVSVTPAPAPCALPEKSSVASKSDPKRCAPLPK